MSTHPATEIHYPATVTDELQQPLAIAVIGGLSLSAALSLLVLPALAAGLHRGPSA